MHSILNRSINMSNITINNEHNDKLWTTSYILACLATFLLSLSFFLQVPTLPFYLSDTFGIDKSTIGLVLSCYVVAVLCVRPFAGFVADTFPRKTVYIIAYSLFVTAFVGYLVIPSVLWVFIMLRIFHGLTFGALNTTANTLVIDVMPSSRRGEGLGYYGVGNNLAMAFGPMIGLFIISEGDYVGLFTTSLACSCVGLCVASCVKVNKKAKPAKASSPISLDRFILKAGLPAAAAFVLLAIPYGITSSYIAVYADYLGMIKGKGLFFTVQACGLIISRLRSGKQVDHGMVTQVIRNGIFFALFGILGLVLLQTLFSWNYAAGVTLYFVSAFIMGYGFGTLFPAFNTLFINLAPHTRRATANATYLTGWDLGIGLGMLIGGTLSEIYFPLCFAVGLILAVISFIYFIVFVTPHYNEHKLDHNG